MHIAPPFLCDDVFMNVQLLMLALRLTFVIPMAPALSLAYRFLKIQSSIIVVRLQSENIAGAYVDFKLIKV